MATKGEKGGEWDKFKKIKNSISFKQHEVGTCLFIQSDILCLITVGLVTSIQYDTVGFKPHLKLKVKLNGRPSLTSARMKVCLQSHILLKVGNKNSSVCHQKKKKYTYLSFCICLYKVLIYGGVQFLSCVQVLQLHGLQPTRLQQGVATSFSRGFS